MRACPKKADNLSQKRAKSVSLHHFSQRKSLGFYVFYIFVGIKTKKLKNQKLIYETYS